MVIRKTMRRYVYDDIYQEVMEWAKIMIKEQRMMKSPNGIPNFPFYLEQYLKHLKFEARKPILATCSNTESKCAP